MKTTITITTKTRTQKQSLKTQKPFQKRNVITTL